MVEGYQNLRVGRDGVALLIEHHSHPRSSERRWKSSRGQHRGGRTCTPAPQRLDGREGPPARRTAPRDRPPADPHRHVPLWHQRAATAIIEIGLPGHVHGGATGDPDGRCRVAVKAVLTDARREAVLGEHGATGRRRRRSRGRCTSGGVRRRRFVGVDAAEARAMSFGVLEAMLRWWRPAGARVMASLCLAGGREEEGAKPIKVGIRSQDWRLMT